MTRKPAAARKTSKASNKAASEQLVAPAASALLVLLVLACAVPVLLYGNPYPPGVVPYWGWGTGCTLVLAIFVSRVHSRMLRELPRRSAELLCRPPGFVFGAIAASTAFLLSLGLAVYAFRRSATTSDEMAQLWQARILLHGRLSLPVDPNAEFFSLENVIDAGRWYSQFPIGGPAVLALGALVGAPPWIANPILAGVAVVSLFHFARTAYGEVQGRAVAALFAVTPMFLFMAGTWMNHVPVLCLATIVLALLAEWDRASSGGRAVAFATGIGLALGLMATIRPLDAIIVSVPVGLFQFWIIRRNPGRLGELGAQTIAGLIGVAPLLYANAATTGRALRFGYEVMWGAAHQVGFRVDPYGNAHTLGRALDYAMTYVSELNMYLLAWPVPALLVVAIGLIAVRRTSRWDVLLMGLFVAQVVAYASYSLVGEFLGPRFLYTAIPSLVVLTARTPFVIGERFGPAARRSAAIVIVVCIAVSWSVPMVPYNAWGLATQVRGTRRALKIDIASVVRNANIHHAVVFLREPLGGRLLRRLWGLGVSRPDAAKLLDSSDSCSLLRAVQRVAADSRITRARKPAAIAAATMPYVASEQSIESPDPPLRLSSRESLTPACKAEIETDARMGSISFGPALPLEPIDADGHITGDVIYAADLGAHNETLRARFGDRTWYRLMPSAGGGVRESRSLLSSAGPFRRFADEQLEGGGDFLIRVVEVGR